MTLWILAFVSLADAKKDEAVPITVRVIDESGQPIPTATVKHPEELDAHRVNAVNGEWADAAIYLPDGTELRFAKGLEVRFEVSAPGFATQIVQYETRRRNNLLEIVLSEVDYGDEEFEKPIIQFVRDKPRDVPVTSPAN